MNCNQEPRMTNEQRLSRKGDLIDQSEQEVVTKTVFRPLTQPEKALVVQGNSADLELWIEFND